MGPIRPGGDNLAYLLPGSCALFYLAFLVFIVLAWRRSWAHHEEQRKVYRYEFQDKTLDRAKAVPPLDQEEQE